MIRYSLSCQMGHDFEAWFAELRGVRDAAGEGRHRLPGLRVDSVDKALMAPAVATSRKKDSVRLAANVPEQHRRWRRRFASCAST